MRSFCAYFLVYFCFVLLETNRSSRSHCLNSSSGQITLLFVGQRNVHLIKQVANSRMLLLHYFSCQSCIEADIEQVDGRLKTHEIIKLSIRVPIISAHKYFWSIKDRLKDVKVYRNIYLFWENWSKSSWRPCLWSNSPRKYPLEKSWAKVLGSIIKRQLIPNWVQDYNQMVLSLWFELPIRLDNLTSSLSHRHNISVILGQIVH